MTSKLLDSIKFEEGYRQFPYRCTEGKLTIGYGFNLDDAGLSKQECDLVLEHRMSKIISNVKSTLYFLDIKEEAWEILYEVAYQLGLGGLLKFKNMIKCLEEKDYIGASEEMLDSLWAKQTPNRANRLSNRMKGL